MFLLFSSFVYKTKVEAGVLRYQVAGCIYFLISKKLISSRLVVRSFSRVLYFASGNARICDTDVANLRCFDHLVLAMRVLLFCTSNRPHSLAA